MKKFKGLHVPTIDSVYASKQAGMCEKAPTSTCLGIKCSKCLFFAKNLDKFIEWDCAKMARATYDNNGETT
jgi:hypothetical protein